MLADYLISIYGEAQGLTIVDGVIVEWPLEWGDMPTDDALLSINADADVWAGWNKVKELQRLMIVGDYNINDMMQIHDREVTHANTSPEDYTITEAKYQEWLDYFKLIRENDEALHATPEDAIAALNALAPPSMS